MTLSQIPYRVAIHTWGRRTAVCIEPREVDKASRTFRTAAEALAFADELRRLNGWPIVDGL